MSIATKISILQTTHTKLRTKLISLGLISDSSAGLISCVDAVDTVSDRGSVNAEISAANEEYTIQAGYHNGSGKVAIAAADRLKLIASNIKSGVTILGVVGSYIGEAVKSQVKSVAPTKSKQTITPDEGYDALSAVEVAAIPDVYQDVTAVTATAADVLANKIIVNATGQPVAGTMANNGSVAASIDGLTATSYTIPAGFHSGNGKVSLTDDIETALAAIIGEETV